MNNQFRHNVTTNHGAKAAAFTLKAPISEAFNSKNAKIVKGILRRAFNERLSLLPDKEVENLFKKAQVVLNLKNTEEISKKTGELIRDMDELISEVNGLIGEMNGQINSAKENLTSLFKERESQLPQEKLENFSQTYKAILNQNELTPEEILEQTANLICKMDDTITTENVALPKAPTSEVTNLADSGIELNALLADPEIESKTLPPLRMPFVYRSFDGSIPVAIGEPSISPLMYMVAHTRYKGKNDLIKMMIGDYMHTVVDQLTSKNTQNNPPIILPPIMYLQPSDKEKLSSLFNEHCKQPFEKGLLELFSSSNDDLSQPLARKTEINNLAEKHIEHKFKQPFNPQNAQMVGYYNTCVEKMNAYFTDYVVLQHLKRQFAYQRAPLLKDLDPDSDMINFKIGHGYYGDPTVSAEANNIEKISADDLAEDLINAGLKPGVRMVASICFGADVVEPTKEEFEEPSSNRAHQPRPERNAQPIAAHLVRSIQAKAKENQKAKGKQETAFPTTIYASSGAGVANPKENDPTFERVLVKQNKEGANEITTRASRDGLTYQFDLDTVEVYKINEEAHELIAILKSHPSLNVRSKLKDFDKTKLASVDQAKELVNKLKDLLIKAEGLSEIKENGERVWNVEIGKKAAEIDKQLNEIKQEIIPLLAKNKSKFSTDNWKSFNDRYMKLLTTSSVSLEKKEEKLKGFQVIMEEISKAALVISQQGSTKTDSTQTIHTTKLAASVNSQAVEIKKQMDITLGKIQRLVSLLSSRDEVVVIGTKIKAVLEKTPSSLKELQVQSRNLQALLDEVRKLGANMQPIA